MSLADLLVEHEILSSLPADSRRALVETATGRRYPAETWITRAGERWPYLFLLECGRIQLVKESAEGRTLLVTTLQPGEVFWGLAFFEPETAMTVSLVAETACAIYRWDRGTLVPIVRRDGEIGWLLLRLMFERILRASDIVENLAFQPIAGRLANLLLDHYQGAPDTFMPRDLTLEEMAARIGTKREIVCRQLYRLEDEGAIELSRTTLRIVDREALKRFASLSKG